MKRDRAYKITIIALAALLITESVLLLRLWSVRPKKEIKPVVIKGKIAIVIDDWGYNLNNLVVLEEIKYPLTLSVLPGLSYSLRVAESLYKSGFEIILHLPMEPYEKFRLEANTIMTTMDEPTIRGIIAQDLLSVPHAKGVSNHMGSKATESLRTMNIIFGELKKRKLYFLDSLVSSDSLCFDLTRKMRLGFAKRDVFLDNQEDSAYIKNQIYKLKTRAKVYGEAIGIGHDREMTLKVLKEIMPQLEREGYKFVFVSELVH